MWTEHGTVAHGKRACYGESRVGRPRSNSGWSREEHVLGAVAVMDEGVDGAENNEEGLEGLERENWGSGQGKAAGCGWECVECVWRA